jgi:pimeloyl-ACP methyl ester carboxylesterase
MHWTDHSTACRVLSILLATLAIDGIPHGLGAPAAGGPQAQPAGGVPAQHVPGAGLESYRKAKDALDAGVGAMGGEAALRATATVRRTLSGDWFGSGQGPSPEPFSGPALATPRSNGRTRLTSIADYRGGRFLDEAVESDFSGDSITRLLVLTETLGFETITYRNEKPFHRSFTANDLPSLSAARLRRHPEGILLMALDRPETLEWVGTGEASGRPQSVISMADPVGTRVLLYFDVGSHLLTRTETLRSHPIAGDSACDTVYDDYRTAGVLRLPFHYLDLRAGVPTEEMRASAIELNVPFPQERLGPPMSFARVEDVPEEQAVEALGDGLYLVRGPYNTVFAVFGDGIVVFEAPLGSRYSETTLRLIRETVPDKPIRHLVSSHFHFDHVAGVRPYIAEGVPIVTTPDAKGVIEKVAAAPHTMHPDALSREPRQARIETVTGRRVFGDGSNRVEIHDFGPTEHAEHLLVPYFPKQKALFVADLWDILSTEQVIAGADAARMARTIRRLGLDVNQIIPVHGAPGTNEMLGKALAVRAKYVPSDAADAAPGGLQAPLLAAGRPRERFENAEILYDWAVNSRGDRLRTFITRPRTAEGKVPVIFFVGWLSCDSIESPEGETDGFAAVIRRLIETSGYATVRMDKPGVGESQGTPCGRSDFQGELEGYQSAFDSMKSHAFIDLDRVFVVGISNGGGVAPLVTRERPVRGFVAAGSWGRTWYEHMLDAERKRLAEARKSPGQINEAVKAFAEFYLEYLVRGRTPGEIVRLRPEWKSLWYDAADGQYGRPAAFYQQLQAANLGRAWERVSAPVLVIRGSEDEYMSRADSEAIAESVNRLHPGRARYLEIEGMTHGFSVRGRFHADIVRILLDWMQEQLPAAAHSPLHSTRRK